MNHALITGGAGAIGLHLARHLIDHNWKVTLLDNFQRGQRDADLETVTANEQVTMLDIDLANLKDARAAGTDYTHIYHLAALVGVQNVVDRPRAVLELNHELTVVALEIARQQKALERFVFASTSEVYAGTLENFSLPLPTPESTPLALPPLDRPRTTYMLSKLYGEALCLQSGVPVTIIRPHNVYGPRMGRDHVIPQLLERAHRLPEGQEFDVYSVDHSRTFCYVDDAVKMIFLLSTSEEALGQVSNVGTQDPEIQMGGLAQIILNTVGRSATIAPLPAPPGSPLRRVPDMGYCRQLTGYESLTSLEDGIAKTYEWYRPLFE